MGCSIVEVSVIGLYFALFVVSLYEVEKREAVLCPVPVGVAGNQVLVSVYWCGGSCALCRQLAALLAYAQEGEVAAGAVVNVGIVELVAPDEGGLRSGAYGHLPVAEMEVCVFHRGAEGQHAAHGCVVDVVAEVHEAAAFGIEPAVTFGILAYRRRHAGVGGYLPEIELGVAAGEIDQVAVGQPAVVEGREEGDAAQGLQGVDVGAVDEVEGFVFGNEYFHDSSILSMSTCFSISSAALLMMASICLRSETVSPRCLPGMDRLLFLAMKPKHATSASAQADLRN